MLLFLFASMPLLRELLDMGFTPFMAVVLVVVVVLWGSLLALLAFFWRHTVYQKIETDRLRDLRYKDINGRLEECETDREELREDVGQLKEKVARLEVCPKKGCPMRLPP